MNCKCDRCKKIKNVTTVVIGKFPIAICKECAKEFIKMLKELLEN